MKSTKEKIVSLSRIEEISQKLKKQGKKIVTTNGCFDILHAGHVQALEEAKSQGDILVLGLNSDASVRAIKGPRRPIHNATDRAQVLAGLACVDYVCIFSQKDPRVFLSKVKPTIHVKSSDWKGKGRLIEQDVVEAGGGHIYFSKIKKGRSTTGIIDRILEMHK